jgi:hypothetical protein
VLNERGAVVLNERGAAVCVCVLMCAK